MTLWHAPRRNGEPDCARWHSAVPHPRVARCGKGSFPEPAWSAPRSHARVAELADAPDLGSGTARCGGSSPLSCTRLDQQQDFATDRPAPRGEAVWVLPAERSPAGAEPIALPGSSTSPPTPTHGPTDLGATVPHRTAPCGTVPHRTAQRGEHFLGRRRVLRRSAHAERWSAAWRMRSSRNAPDHGARMKPRWPEWRTADAIRQRLTQRPTLPLRRG